MHIKQLRHLSGFQWWFDTTSARVGKITQVNVRLLLSYNRVPDHGGSGLERQNAGGYCSINPTTVATYTVEKCIITLLWSVVFVGQIVTNEEEGIERVYTYFDEINCEKFLYISQLRVQWPQTDIIWLYRINQNISQNYITRRLGMRGGEMLQNSYQSTQTVIARMSNRIKHWKMLSKKCRT